MAHLREAGHEVVDVGAYALDPGDDDPDFVIPLAQAVATAKVERGSSLRQRRRCSSLCQKDSGHPSGADSRSLLGPARS